MNLKFVDMSEYTLEELRDLLKKKEERLKQLQNQPTNLYIPGDSMTYMSAMSQMWGIDGCKEDIRTIKSEIQKRGDQ